MLQLVVGGRSPGEGRRDWAVLVFQWISLGCFAFSNEVTPSKRWNVFRGQEKQLGWLNMEYIHHCVLITCVWLYLFISLLCPPCAGHRGKAWATTVLTALLATLDTSVLPSTCYIKPMGMHESWATLAIIPGAVADACLLEKCHSHPQPTEELTSGDAWNCIRDICSASPPAVIMSSISFRGHILVGSTSLWAPCLAHITRCASEVIWPVFSVVLGRFAWNIMAICCSCTHYDSPSFSLEVVCSSIPFWFFSVHWSFLLLL